MLCCDRSMEMELLLPARPPARFSRYCYSPCVVFSPVSTFTHTQSLSNRQDGQLGANPGEGFFFFHPVMEFKPIHTHLRTSGSSRAGRVCRRPDRNGMKMSKGQLIRSTPTHRISPFFPPFFAMRSTRLWPAPFVSLSPARCWATVDLSAGQEECWTGGIPPVNKTNSVERECWAQKRERKRKEKLGTRGPESPWRRRRVEVACS